MTVIKYYKDGTVVAFENNSTVGIKDGYFRTMGEILMIDEEELTNFKKIVIDGVVIFEDCNDNMEQKVED